MTEVTKAMFEAGVAAEVAWDRHPTVRPSLAEARYLAMEAARIPAAPDDVTEAMLRAGQRAETDNHFQPVEVSVRAIYLEMEAARIPAPDDVERVADILRKAKIKAAGDNDDSYSYGVLDTAISEVLAALSAIPIPATGEVERLRAGLAWAANYEPELVAQILDRTDHTTKDDE